MSRATSEAGQEAPTRLPEKESASRQILELKKRLELLEKLEPEEMVPVIIDSVQELNTATAIAEEVAQSMRTKSETSAVYTSTDI